MREFESGDTESLFDYNLNNLTIDEARKASDWDVRYACGRALADADKTILAIFFDRLMNTTQSYWEFGFDSFALQPSSRDSDDDVFRKRKNWRDAFVQVAGDDAVLTGKASVEQLERKGYKPIKAPENLVNAAALYGLQTPALVLSADELLGREITDATPDAQAAVDFVWAMLEEAGMTNAKPKPPVRCFMSFLDGGVKLNGYYREGTVFINSDLAGAASVMGGRQALSDRLLKVALEECVHFTTGALDNSRDFQDFLLDLAVKLARSESEVGV